MSKSRVLEISGIVACLAVIAGLLFFWDTDSKDESSQDSSSEERAEPVATRAPQPTRSPAPVLPEAARNEGKEGAEAFVRTYFATVNYALESGDGVPLEKFFASICTTCNGFLDNLKSVNAKKYHYVGGAFTAKRVTVQKMRDYYLVVSIVDRAAVEVRDSENKVIQADEAQSGLVSQVALYFANGSWLISATRQDKGETK